MQHKKKYVTYYLQKYENAELLVNFTLDENKSLCFTWKNSLQIPAATDYCLFDKVLRHVSKEQYHSLHVIVLDIIYSIMYMFIQYVLYRLCCYSVYYHCNEIKVIWKPKQDSKGGKYITFPCYV